MVKSLSRHGTVKSRNTNAYLPQHNLLSPKSSIRLLMIAYGLITMVPYRVVKFYRKVLIVRADKKLAFSSLKNR